MTLWSDNFPVGCKSGDWHGRPMDSFPTAPVTLWKLTHEVDRGERRWQRSTEERGYVWLSNSVKAPLRYSDFSPHWAGWLLRHESSLRPYHTVHIRLHVTYSFVSRAVSVLWNISTSNSRKKSSRRSITNRVSAIEAAISIRNRTVKGDELSQLSSDPLWHILFYARKESIFLDMKTHGKASTTRLSGMGGRQTNHNQKGISEP